MLAIPLRFARPFEVGIIFPAARMPFSAGIRPQMRPTGVLPSLSVSHLRSTLAGPLGMSRNTELDRLPPAGAKSFQASAGRRTGGS